MKERNFNEGDTIAIEGETGIGFFLIEEGEATVSIGGEERGILKAGDHFGEVALIDDGCARQRSPRRLRSRSTASPRGSSGRWSRRTGLAWKLLQEMAKRLRDAELRAG